MAQYVARGGAVLVAAGPDFASADSIFRSPLGPVIPAEPTARVLEQRYRPQVTDMGQRHPVTGDLGDPETWGGWLRQIEVTPTSGNTLMSGLDDRPLLVLDRVGEGRVALLASDHAWLWNRGYEGGGPQLELLRRLAHWMMKEPELEEEALVAEVDEEGSEFILLFEDLGPARGGNQIAGCTIEDARAAIRQAAAIHAPSWHNSAILTADWLQRSEAIDAQVRTLYPQAQAVFAERYAERAGTALPPLVFYYVYGLWRIAVIIQQIYARYKAGHTKDPRFAGLGAMVRLLALQAAQSIDKDQI